MPPWSVHGEIVEMAGGADAVSARAAAGLEVGQPVEALHLVDMALEAEPRNGSALRVRLGALRELLERSKDLNHYEVYWLRHRIDEATRLLSSEGEGRERLG